MIAGDVFDLHIGADEVSGLPLYIRVQIDEHFTGPDGRERLRLSAIGGGKTNVPRWDTWPRLTYDRATMESMRRTGQLQPAVGVVL